MESARSWPSHKPGRMLFSVTPAIFLLGFICEHFAQLLNSSEMVRSWTCDLFIKSGKKPRHKTCDYYRQRVSPWSSVVRYPRYLSSIPVVGIVDTYVMIPPRCIVAVNNIVRRCKYREYRDTVQVVPLGNECTLQVCDTETNLIVTVKQWVH